MPIRHQVVVTPQRRKASLRVAATESLLLGPAVLLVLVFTVTPIVIAIYLSMTNWDGFSSSMTFIGLDNYLKLGKDKALLNATVFTIVLAVIGALVCNSLGLACALLLNRSTRINNVMRAAVFYPYVIGPIIIGFLWSSILGTNGAINSVITQSGGDLIPFLSRPGWAAASVIAVIIWSGFGMSVVLYLAGLQTVPDSLIEAARIDGASSRIIFWNVKLPLLAPVVTVNLVLLTGTLLRTYELVLALTGGGPARSTETFVYQILASSFAKFQLGYGAAQSVVLMIAIVAITVLITIFRRRREEAVSS